MSCPACRMYVADSPMHFDAKDGFVPVEGPVWHECPEPMPYELARMYKWTANAVGGIVVTPRLRAAIRLGLERGPDA